LIEFDKMKNLHGKGFCYQMFAGINETFLKC